MCEDAVSNCCMSSIGQVAFTKQMRLAFCAAVYAGTLLVGQRTYAQSGGAVFQGQLVSRGSHLGVQVSDIDSDRATTLKIGDPKGVEVVNVEEGSPAENAGIRPDDVLVTYNGEEILSGPQLGRLVGETPPGRKVKMQYIREGKAKSTVVLLASGEPASAYAPSQFRSWTVSAFPVMLTLWNDLQLGITCEPIDSQLAQYFGVTSGILIRSSQKGWAADKAGLRVGDVITHVDTRAVNAPGDLISYLRTQREPVKTLALVFVRDRKSHHATISLVDR